MATELADRGQGLSGQGELTAGGRPRRFALSLTPDGPAEGFLVIVLTGTSGRHRAADAAKDQIDEQAGALVSPRLPDGIRG